MRSLELLFVHGAPVREVQPWNKAMSYSTGAHAALAAFFLLFTFHTAKLPTTVLTEVKFIETPAPMTAAKGKGSEPLESTVAGKDTRGVSPDSVMKKSGLNVNASGDAALGTTPGGEANGKGAGAVGAAQPLSGPIVTNETLGWVGRRQGALIELNRRAGGEVGGGTAGKKGSGTLQEPIALGKMGVDEIRKKEVSIGAPLISGKVGTNLGGGSGSGAIGGSAGRQLAGEGDLGQKRKASVESLKANPFDDGKWGKQKGPFSLEGPLKYRKILKMELPPYPRWAEEKGIEASVSIRLWVDSKGKVKENMYLEKTSGYSELDHVAMEALQQFVFVPIPSDQAQDDEWGVATFRFELKH